MDLLEAIILGIVQGLTEFIPISSTAHLTLFGHIFGLIDSANPEKWTAFIAVIQLGTLAAVLVYFYKDIINITTNFTKENILKRLSYKNQSPDSRLGWMIILGTFPVVIIGLSFKGIIEGNLTKDPVVIASSLIILALILGFAEKIAKFKKQLKDISIKDAIIVGFAQSLALIPGASRSGTTITAGLFLGMNREVAARFSFLLSIPAIFASGVYEFYKTFSYFDSQIGRASCRERV